MFSVQVSVCSLFMLSFRHASADCQLVSVCLCLCVCVCSVKGEVDSRLCSAQTALMLQEDAMRHSDHELKQLMDKMSSLERALGAAESDKHQLQVIERSTHRSINQSIDRSIDQSIDQSIFLTLI